MQTEDHRLAQDATLVFRAEAGDEVSFEELYQRHAPAAWRLALAVVADHTDASEVVCRSFAKIFTLLRAGLRNPDEPFDQMLLTITRNTALDHLRSTDGSAEDDPRPRVRTLPEDAMADLRPVADAYDRLPEQWRSVLWLCSVEDRSPRRTAPILGLASASTVQLSGRAREGLEQQYRSEHGAPADGRVVERLPELALPLPALLVDDARAAWTTVVTAPEPATTTGLSATTEKVLAGVSAMAAAVGVLGASLLGGPGSRSADESAAPVAPIVTDEPVRTPVDLDAGVEVPAAPTFGSTGAGTSRTSDSGTASTTRSSGSSAAEGVQGTSGSAPVAGDLDDAGSDQPGTTTTTSPTTTTPAEPKAETPDDGSTGTPSVTVGTTVADTPVAVEVSEDPGATAGPVSGGSEPAPADEPVETSGLEPLDPVVEPVLDAAGAVVGSLDAGL